jgi:hypothetical protein
MIQYGAIEFRKLRISVLMFERADLHEGLEGNKQALAAVTCLLRAIAAEATCSRLEQSFKVPEDAMQRIRAPRKAICSGHDERVQGCMRPSSQRRRTCR